MSFRGRPHGCARFARPSRLDELQSALHFAQIQQPTSSRGGSSAPVMGYKMMDIPTIVRLDADRGNPLELVERLVTANNWPFERGGDDEITIVAQGKWTDYQVSFTWMSDLESLHIACAYELKVPERSQSEVLKLITMINSQLWVGHFDLWMQDGLVTHRHSLVLSGGVEASGRQCEVLLSNALDACELYYPAFQFVVWAGEGAREAMEAAMFETAGHA
jgi:hypothetical protein